MFERFTDRARRVVVLSQEEARMLDHTHIGTGHLLLGLMREGGGVAAEALESWGVSPESVIYERGRRAPSGLIPFTPQAKRALELSLREALRLGHHHIGAEHLLLGLIREGEGDAAQIMVKLGVDLNQVRGHVQQLALEHEGRAPVGVEAGAAQGTSSGLQVFDQFDQFVQFGQRFAALAAQPG